ncbi:anhydro-N-acetylmuramic acid kinase [Celeribacter arenosi]|uniref:Anhydro-N-acetylmuramic acid kinase n=1 Tax=Celeribacter arenosi TaxID=792649 RepID=A0ABP7KCW6_9RHOB
MGAGIWVAGCMSGTSLDGVDVAMIRTDGVSLFEAGDHVFRPYSEAEQAVLRAALGSWDAPSEVTELIETAHAEALSHLDGYELIGFHGQTLAHDPANRRTYQAGDGSILAEVLGAPVVWDFRTADVQMGGQGAPLAPFYHHALARVAGLDAPVVIVNLGGVGNMTYVDPRIADPVNPAALLAFDTGPANAPINDLMRDRMGRAFDEGGAVAALGAVNADIVADFLTAPFFAKMPPKSLDRNDFHALLASVAELDDAGAIATLTACVSASVAASLNHCPHKPSALYVTGGGRHNDTLMAMLTRDTGLHVAPIEDLGFDGDMLEAQAFAFLAARVLNGLATSAPSTTGVSAAIGGGRVSRPT